MFAGKKNFLIILTGLFLTACCAGRGGEGGKGGVGGEGGKGGDGGKGGIGWWWYGGSGGEGGKGGTINISGGHDRTEKEAPEVILIHKKQDDNPPADAEQSNGISIERRNSNSGGKGGDGDTVIVNTGGSHDLTVKEAPGVILIQKKKDADSAAASQKSD